MTLLALVATLVFAYFNSPSAENIATTIVPNVNGHFFRSQSEADRYVTLVTGAGDLLDIYLYPTSKTRY